MPFPLPQILSAALTHPFYTPSLTASSTPTLKSFPLLDKPTLHTRIQTAISNTPGFLTSTFISPTGGTSGSSPCYFITDSSENRAQRVRAGHLMSHLGAVVEGDVVLNVHAGRGLYRSLELTGDLIEHAGGTNVPAGFDHADDKLGSLAHFFHATVITGTASRLLIFARYLLAHPDEGVVFNKVVYTSEPLPAYQEEYLRRGFRCQRVVSLYGSAECGVWAVSVPDDVIGRGYRELVFEEEMVVVEVVDDDGGVVLDGGVGEIVVTSLMRCRNPVVRYRTGDVGSVGKYAEGYGSVRLYGRHPDRSFHLNGEKFDVVEVEKVMGDEGRGVLEWQVVIDSDHVGAREETVEFRVVFRDSDGDVEEIKRELLRLGGVYITAGFEVRGVEYSDLEKGSMANKIRKIIDRR